jgi:hypothetical protein
MSIILIVLAIAAVPAFFAVWCLCKAASDADYQMELWHSELKRREEESKK